MEANHSIHTTTAMNNYYLALIVDFHNLHQCLVSLLLLFKGSNTFEQIDRVISMFVVWEVHLLKQTIQ